MINHLSQLQELIFGSALESCELAELTILDTEQKALAIRVNHHHAFSAWQIMREKVEETGRWPVLVAGWGNHSSSWLQQLHQENLFNRFPFQYELHRENQDNINPEQIISNAQHIDLDASLKQLSLIEEQDLQDYLAYTLAQTQEQFGEAPEESLVIQLIEDGQLDSGEKLEHWLFNWEIEHFGEKAIASIDNSYIQWFDSVNAAIALLLMPTPNSWEILAYISWFGAESCSSELVIALLKHWHHQYRAELVAHYGTMLQLITKTLPNSPEAAFRLAWEQQLIAPCTTYLPGVSLRNHAREMLHSHQWFLHERP
jgi:hypothetical protein